LGSTRELEVGWSLRKKCRIPFLAPKDGEIENKNNCNANLKGIVVCRGREVSRGKEKTTRSEGGCVTLKFIRGILLGLVQQVKEPDG